MMALAMFPDSFQPFAPIFIVETIRQGFLTPMFISVLFCQSFPRQILKVTNSPKFFPATILCYTVYPEADPERGSEHRRVSLVCLGATQNL